MFDELVSAALLGVAQTAVFALVADFVVVVVLIFVFELTVFAIAVVFVYSVLVLFFSIRDRVRVPCAARDRELFYRPPSVTADNPIDGSASHDRINARGELPLSRPSRQHVLDANARQCLCPRRYDGARPLVDPILTDAPRCARRGSDP